MLSLIICHLKITNHTNTNTKESTSTIAFLYTKVNKNETHV